MSVAFAELMSTWPGRQLITAAGSPDGVVPGSAVRVVNGFDALEIELNATTAIAVNAETATRGR